MARDVCDICCQPGQLGLGVDVYRTTQLRILCGILAAVDALDPEGTNLRFDWELLCNPADGSPVLWRAQYTTAGVVGPITAFNLDGTAYVGDIDDLVSCAGAPGTRYDYELLCNPADGTPVLWRAEYSTDGTVVSPPEAFNLDGTAYGGDIEDLVACTGEAFPNPANVVLVNPTVLTARFLDTDPTGQMVKSAAGSLYGAEVFNNGAVLAYVKLYNKASAATAGDTPIKTWMVPALSGAIVPIPTPIPFSLGLSIRATTGVADADTADPGTNVVVTNWNYV